jgi:hypothetical protein
MEKLDYVLNMEVVACTMYMVVEFLFVIFAIVELK